MALETEGFRIDQQLPQVRHHHMNLWLSLTPHQSYIIPLAHMVVTYAVYVSGNAHKSLIV